MAGLFTIFVDNLPKSMEVGWLRQLFRPYGCVEDVYMPSKRSSSFNTKFGFIRFKRREEAMNAIEDLDGFMIRNSKIVVQFAKYSKNSSSMSQKIIEGDKKVNLAPNLHCWRPKAIEIESNQINSNCLSYADALKGGSFSMTKLVDAKEVDLDWLHMSAVGKLINFCYVNTLQDLFVSNGIWDAQIRHMGGLNVLISFDSFESLNDFLKDNDKMLPNWFSSVEAWDNQKIKSSRCVWISCYGVPLNAWCSSTFINIGKLWGDVIRIDELTEKSIAFDKGRMFILTDFLDCINEVIHVKINGEIYPIKVIEDPMAETCWEKHVFTSIKIKKGNDIIGKEDVIEIDLGDDVAVDFEVKDAQMENSDGGSRVDLLDASIHNDLDDDVDLEDGINDGHALKEDSLLEDAPISLLQHNGFKHTTFDESIPVAEVTTTSSGSVDSSSDDLVSADPLINYVEYMRHKKKARAKKGFQRKPLWTKNPLKSAIYSRTVSRDQTEKRSKSLKLGLKKDSFDGHSLSTEGEASSDIRKRNAILIKEARESMEINASLGVKFFGRESYNIKKFLEIQGVDISEQDIKAIIDLEEGTSISVEF